MSLREEMWRYEQLTGESAEHIPIIQLGAYLDGVDKGIEELEKIKAEIEEYRNCIPWDKECLIKFEAINYIYENIIWKHISKLKGEL